MEILKDDKNLVKHLLDLANKSYSQNIFTFSEFLSESEIGVFYNYEREFDFIKYKIYGGMDDSERCMIRFGNEEELGYEELFPITCLQIKPLIYKFADDLSHRDYLGAIMNLGIVRITTGDIIVQDKNAYVFVSEKIKQFIIDNLDKIKHTNVKIEEVAPYENIRNKEPEQKDVMVQSLRIDSIISKIYNKSRSQSIELFREHKVFVNGKIYENNSGTLRENDMVSVRGYGRFRYIGIQRNTNKGKIVISVEIF